MMNTLRCTRAISVTLALGFVAVACTGSGGSSDPAPGSGAAAPVRSGDSVQALSKDPGERGKPGGSQPPGTTRAYLARLEFNDNASESHTVAVDCHPTSGSGNPQVVDLKIQAERRALLLHFPRDNQRDHGRFVAKVTNVGSGTCEMFRLARDESAYWWIGSNFLGIDQARFIKVNPSTGESIEVATARYVTGPAWGTGGHTKPDRAHARWNQNRLLESPGTAPLTHGMAWISCELGCCVATSITAR